MNNRCSSSLSHRIGLSSGNTTTTIVVVSSPPCLCAGSCLPTTRRVTWIGDLNSTCLAVVAGLLWMMKICIQSKKKHWVVGDYNYTIVRDFFVFGFLSKSFRSFHTKKAQHKREMKSAVKFHIFFFSLPFYQFFSLVSLTMVIMTDGFVG